MSVVRVTADMGAPVSMPSPLHLDAILMAARPSHAIARMQRCTNLAELPEIAIPIPLLTVLGRSAYLCSAAMLPDDARVSQERITKRRDLVDVGLLTGDFHVSSGPGRDYCLPVPVIETPTVSWLAVAKAKAVRQIVERVQQLGQKRRHGLGAIASWTVEPTDLPSESVLVGAGRALRALPATWVEWSDGVETGPCRPPYWHPDRRESRVAPGTMCALHPDVRTWLRRLDESRPRRG